MTTLKFTIIPTDPTIPELVIDLGDQPKAPNYDAINAWLRHPSLANLFPSGNFEHVYVYLTPDRKPTAGVHLETKGIATDMFVDEMGAYNLDPNPRATEIYQCNMRSQGPYRTSDLNPIHGDAVLFSRRVWY